MLKQASNPANDIYHVCGAENKKEALKKYRDLLEKTKLERKTQRLAKGKEDVLPKKSSNTRKKKVKTPKGKGRINVNKRSTGKRRTNVSDKKKM